MTVLAQLFFVIFFFGVWSGAMGIAVVSYVFQSLGLMKMLKSVGYKRPWFAWIPLVNALAIGDLADCYDNGKPSKKLGKKLLFFSIALIAVALVYSFVSGFTAILTPALGTGGDIFAGELNFSMIIAFVIEAFRDIVAIAMIAIAVPNAIFTYQAYWGIFRIFNPSASVIYILLSVFVSEAMPFIFFFDLAKKEPQNLRGAKTDEPAPEIAPESAPENPYTYG